MNRRFSASLLVSVLIATAACTRAPSDAAAEAEHGSGAAEPDHAEPGHESEAAGYERGPHRGRLLRDGDFALELQIFEQGVPPEFHVYLYRDGTPLPPDGAEVSVALTRLGDRIDRFSFEPRGDYLQGSGTVVEPHSFSVEVTATLDGRTHRWNYDSFEGRTRIAARTAEEAGVRTEVAGPAVIDETIELTGRIVPNAEHVRTVSARFPGAIREVKLSVGEPVRAGEPLAIIESNDSLQRYTVSSPIDGVVVERHANPGETADSEPLFVIADYSKLWAELVLFPRELPRVRVGQTVTLAAVDADSRGTGSIVRIAPTEGEGHGSLSGLYAARVALDNSNGTWTPGLFVRGTVRVGAAEVPIAVRRSGLQAFRDFTVVFERIGDTYEVRMLELGRQDETHVEVLGGIEAGAQYVAENSFLIKADVEKSGASHDH